ncbi:hypothetical protein O181_075840 [Austropuccinia psidii MF-1]|uniref:SRP9 domain-containing protein n=1 Tax=Austropuccinia psidii MF-1 TaxID=1389203 RepID=A0A9Q3IEE5_9BASI|nr:hypothetical protein [Austropuccinia psidii MF-1]
MVYFKDWNQFVSESIKLFEISPNKTRYCIRWKSQVGLLVLKVTNDLKCLKFKTKSAIYFNRFDQFTRDMTARFQNRNINNDNPSSNITTTNDSINQNEIHQEKTLDKSNQIKSTPTKSSNSNKKKGKKKK